VQETIVRAWRHPEALADRPARPWLFAVARNLAVDSYRARQARPPETGQAALELLPADDDADRIHVRVQHGLVTLTGRVPREDDAQKIVGIADTTPGVAATDDEIERSAKR